GGREYVWAEALAESIEWKKIFGDDEIRHTRGRVDGGGQRYGRRIVIMRRNGDVFGLGRRRNVHEFENPAAIRDIGIDDVDGTRADDRTEAGSRQQRFSGHDRNAARMADLRQRLDVL